MAAYTRVAMTGGGFINTFTLAFGHTAVSLATAETQSTKQRRIVLLPALTHAVSSGAAINTMLLTNGVCIFPEAVYVNPSEFVQVCVKHLGTAATAGTIAYNIQPMYAWE
jgi:hypothetical protein